MSSVPSEECATRHFLIELLRQEIDVVLVRRGFLPIPEQIKTRFVEERGIIKFLNNRAAPAPDPHKNAIFPESEPGMHKTSAQRKHLAPTVGMIPPRAEQGFRGTEALGANSEMFPTGCSYVLGWKKTSAQRRHLALTVNELLAQWRRLAPTVNNISAQWKRLAPTVMKN